ncbi:hypothetical protein ACSBR1_017732 [Camellia fascicularis]
MSRPRGCSLASSSSSLLSVLVLSMVRNLGHPVVPSVYTSMRGVYQFSKLAGLVFKLYCHNNNPRVNGNRGISHIRIDANPSDKWHRKQIISENFKNWTPVRLLIRMVIAVQHNSSSFSYQNWSYNEVGIIEIIIFVTVAGIFETYSSIAELVDDV